MSPGLVPILDEILFGPDKGTIRAEFKFDTLLLCAYTIDLREKGSNASVPGFPSDGDNSNPADDLYPLPDPVIANDGRNVWAFLTLIDQTGNGGTYKVDLEFIQDGKKIGQLSTGKKKIEGNFSTEILVGKLLSKKRG